MSIKLRELIRNVRACKTASDERAVIAKETANIRTAIKEQGLDEQIRLRNIAKIMYIHMLGYPTHFAQMEILKLLSKSSFPAKRLSYLCLSLLLDEHNDLLKLATNTILKDLKLVDSSNNANNIYITSLALSAVCNICSVNMANDLNQLVNKLCSYKLGYIRKKAILAAVRILRKVPELHETFITSIDLLIKIYNDTPKEHGPLICTITLMLELLKLNPSYSADFTKHVPKFISILKSLLMSGYSPEHDSNGVCDVFLQCKIVELLGTLGEGNSSISDQSNDILASIATNTDSNKTSGNAILYQTVQTITSIEAEGGLRVLAINILGRFLSNTDNNIRYVALNTLCKAVHADPSAIQRHRATIVTCLKDVDSSIRLRALDLVYALVNDNNAVQLVTELLQYLKIVHNDTEFKAELTDRICVIIDRYSPSKRFRIDTTISVLETAGQFAQDYVSSDLVIIIANEKSLHSYIVHKLYHSIISHPHQSSLVKVGLWTIGEYGEYLVTNEGLHQATLDDDCKSKFNLLTSDEILKTIDKIFTSLDYNMTVKEYAISALGKLTSKLNSEQDVKKINDLLSRCHKSLYTEIQQRSVEYSVLAKDSMANVRDSIFGNLPPLSMSKLRVRINAHKLGVPSANEESDNNESDSEAEMEILPKSDIKSSEFVVSESKDKNLAEPDFLDLSDLMSTPTNINTNSNTTDNVDDILSNVFVSTDTDSTFPSSSSPPSTVVFDKTVKISFSYIKSGTTITIMSTSVNTSANTINNFKIQVAVRKNSNIQINMEAASGDELLANSSNSVIQTIILNNPANNPLVALIRVEWDIGSEHIVETFQPSFPPM